VKNLNISVINLSLPSDFRENIWVGLGLGVGSGLGLYFGTGMLTQDQQKCLTWQNHGDLHLTLNSS